MQAGRAQAPQVKLKWPLTMFAQASGSGGSRRCKRSNNSN